MGNYYYNSKNGELLRLPEGFCPINNDSIKINKKDFMNILRGNKKEKIIDTISNI